MNAERFEDGAHRTTGDDTGTSLGRAQQNLAGAMTAVDVVMQCTTVAQRYEDQIALGALGGLADGFRHFTCLTVAETDATLLVADDDEGCEAEATAALDHLGDAVDRDRSEEHTSELQSLMRISYAVFCLKKKKNTASN